MTDAGSMLEGMRPPTILEVDSPVEEAVEAVVT